MALINHTKREINAKLVYVGPTGAGKETNLSVVYRKMKPDCRSKLKSMATQNGRMLFFDFTLPGGGEVDGYLVRFHLYTLVGGAAGAAAWKPVLKGADGVLFIADSRPEMAAANSESLASLHECLQSCGATLAGTPHVIQCNKRDLAESLPMETMRQLEADSNTPFMPASAAKGEGVMESLTRLVRMVMKELGAGNVVGMQDESPLPASREAGAVPAAPEEPQITSMELSVPVTESAGMVAPEPLPPALLLQDDTVSSREAQAFFDCVGDPQLMGGGCLRLPLSISLDGGNRRVSLTLTISLGQE
jgi:signal recognition particle receptor subunit beta